MNFCKHKVGDIVYGYKIGYGHYGKYIWHACLDCGEERWVQFSKSRPVRLRCNSCARKGSRNSFWKGGRQNSGQGYISVSLNPDDFYWTMTSRRRKHVGYVLEHRLVMAKHLGRCLKSWEIVHHKNHIRNDNRIDNLQLVSDDKHKQITILENKIKNLENRVTLLEVENIFLKKEMENADGILF